MKFTSKNDINEAVHQVSSQFKDAQKKTDPATTFLRIHAADQACMNAFTPLNKEAGVAMNRVNKKLKATLYAGYSLLGITAFAAIACVAMPAGPAYLGYVAIASGLSAIGLGLGAESKSVRSFFGMSMKRIDDKYRNPLISLEKTHDSALEIKAALIKNNLPDLAAQDAIQKHLNDLPQLQKAFAVIGVKTLAGEPHYNLSSNNAKWNVSLKAKQN